MKSNEHQEAYKAVYLSLRITSEENKLLTQASEKSNRTKTQEARLRLHDHLNRFSSISVLNKAEERK